MLNYKNNSSGLSIKGQLRRDWPAVALVVAALVAGCFIYPYLPEQVPAHWNLQGQVDRYASRFWGAFGIPLLSAGIYLMMLLLPVLDPRHGNYAKFAGTYQVLKVTIVCFLTGLYVIVVLSALGYSVSVERLVPLGVSLLIVIIGNIMGRIRHNYFVGIKVPWTLASEQVWQKTHRMAAPIWVLAGLAGMVGALFGGKTAAVFLFAPLSVAVVVPVLYSYLLYRRLHG